MSDIETSSTSPITMTDGTFAGQVGLAYGAGFIQRLVLALTSTCEYIVKIEDPSDTNYADLALFARMVAASPQYWAQQMAWTVVMDSTISAGCSDQAGGRVVQPIGGTLEVHRQEHHRPRSPG
jgi:hypothetical protein